MHKSLYWYKSNISRFWNAIWTLKSKWVTKCGWKDANWDIIKTPISYYKPVWFLAYKSPTREEIYFEISWWEINPDLLSLNKKESSFFNPIKDSKDCHKLLTIENLFISGNLHKENKEFKVNPVWIWCDDFTIDFPFNYWKVWYYLSWDYVKLNFFPEISDKNWTIIKTKYELFINNHQPLRQRLATLENFLKDQKLDTTIIELYSNTIEDYLKLILKEKWIQSSINNLHTYIRSIGIKKDELLSIIINEVKKDILIIKNSLSTAIDFLKYDKLAFETIILKTAQDMWIFFALRLRNHWIESIKNKDIEINYFSNLNMHLKKIR